jgi:metal-responsive CopG/Arc/MetJ family transcriptional regulator
LDRSVIMSPNLLKQVDNFLKENKQTCYDSREDFIEDAIRFRLASLKK